MNDSTLLTAITPIHLLEPMGTDLSLGNTVGIASLPTYSNLTSGSGVAMIDGEQPSAVLVAEEEFCSNSEIVSADTIIAFTENCDLVLFIATILSSILQLYVMCAAVAHIRRRTTDKCMHVFLLSMTFADLLLTAICYPIELAPRAGLVEQFPRAFNATMHMLCWISLIVSSISLVFLNLDKLFYFRFPLRYSNYFTRSRAIGAVVTCWLLSSLFVVFAWLTNSFHCVDDNCVTLAIFPNRLHIYVPFMIFVGFIPTVTSLLVAIYIMRIVAAHRKQLAQERLLCPATGAPVKANSVFASRMRTFYFIFMTTVFTALTLLPYRIAGLARSLNPSRMHECMTIFLFWVMMYMIYLNSIINPLLTITVLPQYRCGTIRAMLYNRLLSRHKEGGGDDHTNTMAKSESALPSHHASHAINGGGSFGDKKRHPHLLPPRLLNHQRNIRRSAQTSSGNAMSNDLSLGQLKEELEETCLLQGGGGAPDSARLSTTETKHNGYLPRNSVI